MPQKPRQFQSKPGKTGQKFGGPRGRGGSDDKGGSNRPRRDAGGFRDRPARSFDRDESRPARGRSAESADRPKRDFSDRPKRDFGDRPKRDFGDKPYKKRSFGDRDEGRLARRPRDGEDGGYKKRDFGDRPKRDFGDRPKRDFGDRGGEGGFKKREFGDKPRGERRERSFDDRPKRDFGDKPKRDFGDRPKRDFGDRPKRDFGDKKPYRKFEDRGRPPRSDDRFEERTPRSYSRQDPAPETLGKLKSARPSYGAPSGSYLYGVHPVTAALLNPQRKHKRLLCTQKSFEAIAETWSEAQEDGITLPEVVTVEREDIERLLSKDAVHQELLLDTSPLEEVFLDDIINAAKDDAKIIVLDQVTDPHNIGAVLRSTAAFGAIAIIVQTLHAPEVTGTLAKSASGAVEHVPIVREVNLSRALEKLKEAGFFCLGLDERGKQTLAETRNDVKTVLVLGAEGAGLRRLVAENCDALVKLPTSGPIASLNVSNAAAIALYELVRK